MVAKRSSRAVALLLVAPSAAFALGLGDIRLLSPLDQPLKAQIELLDATPDALQNLQVQLASQDTFARYGLSWPQFLGGVHVKTVQTADGREVVELSSDQPITDPVLTLLVEANWDRGHLIREYTVLLDPPVYVPNPSQAASAQVAPAAAGTAQREGSIARSEIPASQPPAPTPPAEASSTPATADAAASPSAPASSAGEPHSLVVRRGQTLSAIANHLSGAGLSSGATRSWMVAIYQANPEAFAHNMNLLRSGAVLRIPDSTAVAAISPATASAEIRRQYAAWRGASGAPARGPGRLRLVAPSGGAGAGGSPGAEASAGQVKALQAQVQALQTQLADERRLLQLKDVQLASMQARLAGKQAPPPVSSPATAVPAHAAQAAATVPSQNGAPPATEPPSQTVAAPPLASAQAPHPVAAPAPHLVKRAPKPVAEAVTPTSGGSLFDTLASYWWAIALAVLALLGYIGSRLWRSRRQSEFDDSLGRLAAAGAMPSPYTKLEPSTADTASMRPITAKQDDAFVVEESGTHERPRISAAAPVAARHVTTADQTISSETAVNLDQGDPLAEADFHMAYGLYDQAADLIRIAIGREPERRDLKLKLLEVFFVWGNKEQFLQTARELAESRAKAAAGEWEKIVIMGKQLAPEDPLFTAGEAVSGAASAGVDLDLAGGQGPDGGLDFDIASGRTGQHAQGLDLDIGSALGEGESAATLESSATATDRNLALTDTHFVDNATGSTREMTATLPGGDELPGEFGTEIEGPTIEQPALHTTEQPTLRQKVETALKQSGAEQTAELAIDDLGLDLGAFDVEQPAAAEASAEGPTLVAGLDEHSRKIIEQASEGAAEPAPEPTGTTNAWQIDESELEAVLADGQARTNGHDSAATSRLAALDTAGVDYELGAAEPELSRGANGVDLDVGTATVPDAAFTATQKLSADDLALPDLEPVTLSEVGTKLDLARAYMDMGDPDGARNILEEVMHEGSVAQRQEAERLMQSLPG